jgi:hypothetical protein
MDSSRELASIYAIGFVVKLYLILLIGVQKSNVTGLKFSPEEPNRPLSSSPLHHLVVQTNGSLLGNQIRSCCMLRGVKGEVMHASKVCS